MTVTVIDANHCPGSVMFLFQGYFGTILHTGDFRWANGAIDLSPLDGLTVDILYLDNTYLDSRQAQFPSREEAYALLLDIVKQHPDHIIYIGVDSIGKEELLIQLARDMDMKVAVTRERYRELILMGLAGECFTTDDDNKALIHVMPKERITIELYAISVPLTGNVNRDVSLVAFETPMSPNQRLESSRPVGGRNGRASSAPGASSTFPTRCTPLTAKSSSLWNSSGRGRCGQSCWVRRGSHSHLHLRICDVPLSLFSQIRSWGRVGAVAFARRDSTRAGAHAGRVACSVSRAPRPAHAHPTRAAPRLPATNWQWQHAHRSEA